MSAGKRDRLCRCGRHWTPSGDRDGLRTLSVLVVSPGRTSQSGGAVPDCELLEYLKDESGSSLLILRTLDEIVFNGTVRQYRDSCK